MRSLTCFGQRARTLYLWNTSVNQIVSGLSTGIPNATTPYFRGWQMTKLTQELRQPSEIRAFLNGLTPDGDYACPFCLEIVDLSYSANFLPVNWPFRGRVLSEDENAIALAGYGPQIYPYALVLPRRHVHSLAETTAEE